MEIMELNPAHHFKGKNILVTGGTGSFGYQVVNRLLSFEPQKIVIFSRDEKKQVDMQKDLEAHSSTLQYVLGDVRDYEKVREAMGGIDIVFHAAALKQVPNCEFHPMEAVKTNILGAENVRRAALDNDVEVVVAISTDKAVKPVNVMGMTKAIQEKIFLHAAPELKVPRRKTRFICVRYGNVIGSRGSVIPFFKERILSALPIPVTSYGMTRFLLRLPEAVELVFFATMTGENKTLFVRKMPACYILDLAKVMAKALTGNAHYPIHEVGIRPGEKVHEVLVSEEEMRRAVEKENYYIIYPSLEENHFYDAREVKEFASNTTHILSQEEIKDLLRKENWM